MPTYMITGARGGVASAVRERLRDESTRRVLVSREGTALVAAADETVITADCVQPESVAQIIGACSELDEFNGLVHCVGSVLIAAPLRTSAAQWREVMAVNLDSAFHAASAAFSLFERFGKGGSIVLFSSVAARIGLGNHCAIAAAKAGVEGLTRALAADGAARGIRVNCIAPGLMRSPMTARFVASERAAAQVAAQYPLGRVGEPGEAAALACWLLSDDASWVSGQVFGLDGGFCAVRPLVRA